MATFQRPNGDTTVFSFVAPNNINTWNGDLERLFDYLVSSHGVDTDMVITRLQAGTEPFTGKGLCQYTLEQYNNIMRRLECCFQDYKVHISVA